MRSLIAMATIAGVLGLASVDAQVIKKEEVPKYINILKTGGTAKARAQAASNLGDRGAVRASDVEDAIDPLLNALKNDKEDIVRAASAKALGDIATEEDKCVDALTEALKDKAANVKMAAIFALGQFGSRAQSALTPLREIAKNKDDKKMSQAANQAVKSIAGTKKN
jgi:HEAT repeat protein